MSKHKKYRSLSDVYQTGEDYQDDVSTPYRLTEAWQVVLTDMSGEQQPTTLSISDDDVQEVKNLAKMSEQGGRELAQAWCESANFGYEKYIQSMVYLMQKFDFGDWKGLTSFIQNKKNPKVTLGSIFSKEKGDQPLLKSGLMDVCTDLLQYDSTPREHDAARAFFFELMKISYKVSGTSVGDGEFLLAMLTDGVKGTKETGGDVAVPLEGNDHARYEIGTQKKIIYGGESKARSGLQLDFRRADWTMMRDEFSRQEDEKVRFTLVKQYVENVFTNDILVPHIRSVMSQNIYEALRQNPNDDLGTKGTGESTCQKIIGAAVLYYYISHHGDDVIVIINMPHQLKTAQYEYFARYLRVKDNFQGTLEAILNKHFTITIDGGGVFRIAIPGGIEFPKEAIS